MRHVRPVLAVLTSTLAFLSAASPAWASIAQVPAPPALALVAVGAVGLASNLLLVPASSAILAAGLPLLAADALLPTPDAIWRSLGFLSALVLAWGEWFAGFPGGELPCALPTPAAFAALGALALAILLASRVWREARGPIPN